MQKAEVARLFGTGAAVMFKGSGFYQTDYRSDSYKKAASADSSSGEAKSSSSDAKSEKPKSESKSSDKPSSKNKSSDK